MITSPAHPSNANIASGRSWSGLGLAWLVTITITSPAQQRQHRLRPFLVWAWLVAIMITMKSPAEAQPSNVNIASGRSWSGLGWVTLTITSPAQPNNVNIASSRSWAGMDVWPASSLEASRRFGPGPPEAAERPARLSIHTYTYHY